MLERTKAKEGGNHRRKDSAPVEKLPMLALDLKEMYNSGSSEIMGHPNVREIREIVEYFKYEFQANKQNHCADDHGFQPHRELAWRVAAAT